MTATASPQLKTQGLITKLDEVAKILDPDVTTILQQQLKDPLFRNLRCWVSECISSEPEAPEIRKSEGLLR